MLKLREQQPDNGMSCTHDHGDKSSLKRQKNSYRDIKMKKTIPDSVYLNRAALVGCNNERLSQSYAKQLYTRKYLRNTSVTGPQY
jgi:hypothetical protein